jgi:hypothetical protein
MTKVKTFVPRKNKVVSTQGKIKINHTKEGLDHLNINLSSLNKLARELEFCSNLSFNHPDYGSFNCLEGMLYYLVSHKEKWRTGWGVDIKKYAKYHLNLLTDEMRNKVIEGLHCRFLQYPEHYELFMQNTLPITYYYFYAGLLRDNGNHYRFLVDELAEIQKGKPLLVKSRSLF